jgi:RNA polymerase sigma-70 factor (ECF subfamily)
VAGVRGRSDGARDSEVVLRAIRAFQAGIEQEESFRVLFETYRPAVQGFFLRRLGSLDAGHDLTQETFIRVYKGLKGYRGDAPFGAWLFRIARNVLRSSRTGSATARIRAREVRIEDVEMELIKAQAERGADGSAGEPRALTSAMREEQRRLLRSAVEKLPPQRRRCVILWAYYELTYEQIAVVMRLSIGTIKAHLAQARQQLVHLVADPATDEPRELER